jgi:polyphosphate:AMP phosphotransferase
MLETAELGQRVGKEEYAERLPALRVRLLKAQYELQEASFPVIVLLAGDNRAGCNEMLNVLHEWMDSRLLDTTAMEAPTDLERERPEFWRYWRTLPRRGRIGLFLGAWTMRAIRDRLGKRIGKAGFERAVDRIAHFEQALADDGALILKFWLHIPKRELKKYLDLAEKKPEKVWWVQETDYRVLKNYDRAMKTIEQALRRTGSGLAPWTIVESTDARHRDLAVGEVLAEALERRLRHAARPAPAAPAAPAADEARPEGASATRTPSHTILDTIDLSLELDRATYRKRLEHQRARIGRLTQRARKRGITSVIVMEGPDAAGKGSCIRRITRAMDAVNYRVVQTAAPNEEERAHHYLWRFWRDLPRAGRVCIFDRSWYGRVLVERVEGFASRGEWLRAYGEINELEEQLCEHGILLLKFWIHVGADEQLRRFREREKTSYKKYKITAEDYRNRRRRDDYELAANDMIARTSTDLAPWHLVPSNDKRWARIQVMETFSEALEAKLKSKPRG